MKQQGIEWSPTADVDEILFKDSFAFQIYLPHKSERQFFLDAIQSMLGTYFILAVVSWNMATGEGIWKM